MLRRWIIEAVRATGTAATPLAVSRHVWTHHEAELRAAGDLVLTWQLDLRAAAEAMATEGALVVTATGDWALPATGASAESAARRSWTEDEIAVAVEGYLALLRAEHAGQPLRRTEVVDEVLLRTGRDRPTLEAMMANISAVVQEHGYVPLSAFPPRSNVPVGVRPAVAAALQG